MLLGFAFLRFLFGLNALNLSSDDGGLPELPQLNVANSTRLTEQMKEHLLSLLSLPEHTFMWLYGLSSLFFPLCPKFDW